MNQTVCWKQRVLNTAAATLCQTRVLKVNNITLLCIIARRLNNPCGTDGITMQIQCKFNGGLVDGGIYHRYSNYDERWQSNMAIENTPCYFDSNLENAHLAMGFPSNPGLIPRGSLVCGLPCEILHHPDGGMVKLAKKRCVAM